MQNKNAKPVAYAVINLADGGQVGGLIVQGYGFSFEPLAYESQVCADNMADHLNWCNQTNRYSVRAIY